MRFDSVGMFWQDAVPDKKRGAVIRPMPAIPDTGWVAPRDFPNLACADVIALDTETFDPELEDNGPGWARNKGHVVGVSIAVPGKSWYFPVRHTVEPETNLNPENVFAWLKDSLGGRQPKVGANLTYDVGWLRHEGVQVNGELIDVQFAEALLDESAEVALEALGQRYLKIGKESSLLHKWCSDFYGEKGDSKWRADIHRAPPRLVGPYAEVDASHPLRIAVAQYPLLQREGLLDLFSLECRLIRLLIDMRYKGVKVNLEKAAEVSERLGKRAIELNTELNTKIGFSVNVNAADSLAKAFDSVGVAYPRTAASKTKPNGSPSFTKTFLENLDHPMGDMIREIRSCTKLKSTFVESYILESHVNGRLHCQFHPLRGDANGTRSGRFSSSAPNLQNIPARDKITAPLVRGLFIPDNPDERWRRYDYSQIEYRFLAHYAVGPKSDEIRARYNRDPKTDYHEATQKMIHEIALVLLDRKPVKTINFGLTYGMGKAKLIRSLGLNNRNGNELFKAYHDAVPFTKATLDACAAEAQEYGIITTILNRKSRFDKWQPRKHGDADDDFAMSFHAALMKYGRHAIVRAFTHKALNRRLQGSAADLMKKAMVECYEQGIFTATGIPLVTVHDELGFSDPGGCEEAFKAMRYVLENTLRLKVPICVDEETGPDWGHMGS